MFGVYFQDMFAQRSSQMALKGPRVPHEEFDVTDERIKGMIDWEIAMQTKQDKLRVFQELGLPLDPRHWTVHQAATWFHWLSETCSLDNTFSLEIVDRRLDGARLSDMSEQEFRETFYAQGDNVDVSYRYLQYWKRVDPLHIENRGYPKTKADMLRRYCETRFQKTNHWPPPPPYNVTSGIHTSQKEPLKSPFQAVKPDSDPVGNQQHPDNIAKIVNIKQEPIDEEEELKPLDLSKHSNRSTEPQQPTVSQCTVPNVVNTSQCISPAMVTESSMTVVPKLVNTNHVVSSSIPLAPAVTDSKQYYTSAIHAALAPTSLQGRHYNLADRRQTPCTVQVVSNMTGNTHVAPRTATTFVTPSGHYGYITPLATSLPSPQPTIKTLVSPARNIEHPSSIAQNQISPQPAIPTLVSPTGNIGHTSIAATNTSTQPTIRALVSSVRNIGHPSPFAASHTSPQQIIGTLVSPGRNIDHTSPNAVRHTSPQPTIRTLVSPGRNIDHTADAVRHMAPQPTITTLVSPGRNINHTSPDAVRHTGPQQAITTLVSPKSSSGDSSPTARTPGDTVEIRHYQIPTTTVVKQEVESGLSPCRLSCQSTAPSTTQENISTNIQDNTNTGATTHIYKDTHSLISKVTDQTGAKVPEALLGPLVICEAREQKPNVPSNIPIYANSSGTTMATLPTTGHNIPSGELTQPIKRKRGRPPKPKPPGYEKKKRVKPILWRFLLDSMDDPELSKGVTWVNKEEGLFKFISGSKDIVARRWGQMKGNRKEMTYSKMARALRHYGKRGIFMESRRRLHYKINPNYIQKHAKGRKGSEKK